MQPEMRQPAASTNTSFDLARLLRTVFAPEPGAKIAVVIDLPDSSRMKDLQFLEDPETEVQQRGFEHFYAALRGPVGQELGIGSTGLFAYQQTGGSNLDLPDECVDMNGEQHSFEADVYPTFDILLFVTRFSATAPLTVFAHRHNFRAATLHGMNDIILETGLSADYNIVDAEAEKIRQGYLGAKSVEIDFKVLGEHYSLSVELEKQEPRKSSGVCTDGKPDVVNLPSGEIYFMPSGADGNFPMIFDDGTFAILDAQNGKVVGGRVLSGDARTLTEHLAKIADDPAYGTVGELGIGTQDLPFSGSDIQDEKIIGTIHIATGRMDHLGNEGLGPNDFKHSKNASHDDVLFAPEAMPQVHVSEARMNFEDRTEVIISDYKPSSYVLSLLK